MRGLRHGNRRRQREGLHEPGNPLDDPAKANQQDQRHGDLHQRTHDEQRWLWLPGTDHGVLDVLGQHEGPGGHHRQPEA